MKNYRLILPFVFLLVSKIAAFSQPAIGYHLGEKVTVYSNILEEHRDIFISLPAEYDTTESSYPVLYLLDGERTFIFAEAIGAVDQLSYDPAVSKMIIVAVDNHKNRNRDLLPVRVEDRPGSGEAKKFLSFLEQELKPYINNNYRTNFKDILFGGSNGGLFAVYAVLENPGLFTAYIASSPMIGHCNEYIVEKLKNTREIRNSYLYLNYGEHDMKRAADFIPAFTRLLEDKKWEDLHFKWECREKEGHVPFGSVYAGLQFIFSEGFNN